MVNEAKLKDPGGVETKETGDRIYEGSDDVPGESRQSPALQRRLKSRHLQMIAIGKN
jgi:amino acid permease